MDFPLTINFIIIAIGIYRRVWLASYLKWDNEKANDLIGKIFIKYLFIFYKKCETMWEELAELIIGGIWHGVWEETLM